MYIDNVWSGGTSEDGARLGFPLLSNAIAGGLFRPNCKHTMTTYFEGITTIPSKADVEKTKENSDVISTQRHNERKIREYKRLEVNSLDESNKSMYKGKVREWQGKQRELMSVHPEVHRNYKREGLRGVRNVDTTAGEVKSILENDGFDIPKFSDNKNKLKPIVHNSDGEVSGYMNLLNLKTDNNEIISIIRNDMKLMPKRDLDLLKQFKLDIGEQIEGASHYRKSKRRFLPVKSTINLKETSNPGTFTHEFAHFAADKTNLYKNNDFLDVLENSIRGSKLVETEFNGAINMAVESESFVSRYQGRTYLTPDDYDKVKVIRPNDLKEYISVGYQTYICNPHLLYEKDKKLYDFIKKRGLKNEKQR